MSRNRWTFVGVESGTVEAVEASTWCVSVNALTADELEVLEECEPTGCYGETALEILEARGVALEAALEMVDGLRLSTGLDVEALEAAVCCARGAALEFRPLDEVRQAAADELRRALLILQCIGAGDFDASQALEWLEYVESMPSGLHGALEEAVDVLGADERLALEERVRCEILDGGTLEEWARVEGYRRQSGGLWLNECDDVVTLEDELEDEVQRVADGLEAGRS
jgi:hypothetical protein